MSITDFYKFYCETSKKSINEQDIINNNGVVIDKRLMKVNYKYDIQGLLDNITSKR